MKTIEAFLSEAKDIELTEFFDWEIEASKSLIFWWAELYKLEIYIENTETDFTFYYAISEDKAVLFHFIRSQAKTFKISANSYDYHEKQSTPIRKTGSLSSFLGRGHACETVLSMLFRLNDSEGQGLAAF